MELCVKCMNFIKVKFESKFKPLPEPEVLVKCNIDAIDLTPGKIVIECNKQETSNE